MEVRLLNANEVSNILRLKPNTIMMYARKKKIKSVKTGKQRMFTENAIQEYINKNSR